MCNKLYEYIIVNIRSNVYNGTILYLQTKLTMTYSPLVVGSAEDYLEIHNDLIGVIMYKVKLTCLPAKEKHLDFTTTLGNRIPIRLRVQNRSDARADFECTVSFTCNILYTVTVPLLLLKHRRKKTLPSNYYIAHSF